MFVVEFALALLSVAGLTCNCLQSSWGAEVTEIVALLQGIARQRQAIVNGLRESVSLLAAGTCPAVCARKQSVTMVHRYKPYVN